MSPTVSILIPTHDRAHWLEAALASALAQTHPVLEVRVVDDGGRPATAAVVGRFPDPRVYHDVTAPASGVERNHHRALELARGDLVVFLADDDVLAPEFVAHRVAAFEAVPDVDVVFSGYVVADTDLRPLSRVAPRLKAGVRLGPEDLLGAALSREWSINASMYRRDRLLAAWPPAGSVGNAFDFALHLLLPVEGASGLLGDWCDVTYRLHAQQTSRGDAMVAHFAEGDRTYRHVLSRSLSREQRRRIVRDHAAWQVGWARALASRGELDVARHRLWRALQADASFRGAWTQLAKSYLAPRRAEEGALAL